MKIAIIILTIFLNVSMANATPHRHTHIKPVQYVYICVSRSAHKYHRDRDCRGLAHCTHEIDKVTLSQAIKLGYTACKVCY